MDSPPQFESAESPFAPAPELLPAAEDTHVGESDEAAHVAPRRSRWWWLAGFGRFVQKWPPDLTIWGTLGLFAGLLLWYSVTESFAWDEGFHLLTAQLILRGRRPYVDFFFPQVPLNAYWNAFWMGRFGEGWKVPHVVAAVLVILSAVLIVQFIGQRLKGSTWYGAAGLAAALLFCTNAQIVSFGPIGQGYALCLLLSIVAFRLTILSAGERWPLIAFLAGLSAGTATGSTLLGAPVVPIFALWLLWASRRGVRWFKPVAFAIGAAVPFIPVYRLWRIAPDNVVFNIFKYHFFFRQVDWDGAIKHDVGQYASWLDSVPAFLLGLLTVIGAVAVLRKGWIERDWKPQSRDGSDQTAFLWRAELYLCILWVVGEAIHISRAHPTFARYYMLCVPGMCILAVSGLIIAGQRIWTTNRPWATAGPLSALLVLGIGQTLLADDDGIRWRDLDELAKKVQEVLPANARIDADEHVYFLTKRNPPEGFEHEDSHKLKLPADQARRLHVVNKDEVKKQIEEGKFDALVSCDDDDDNDDKKLPELFAKSAEAGSCKVYWQPTGTPEKPGPEEVKTEAPKTAKAKK